LYTFGLFWFLSHFQAQKSMVQTIAFPLGRKSLCNSSIVELGLAKTDELASEVADIFRAMAMPRGGRVGLKMETEGFRIGSPI
jgi:hypothetical protein